MVGPEETRGSTGVSLRGTSALLVLALSIAAFVWFYELRGGEAREASEELARQVFAEITADQITELSLAFPSAETVSALRTAEGWRMTEPVDFPGREGAFDAMAMSLAAMPSEGHIEVPTEFSVYGLGNNARTVHFAAGGIHHALRIGRGTPTDGNVYVMRGDARRVETVAAWRLRAFDRTVDELRESRLLPGSLAAIERITLLWREASRADDPQEIVLERAGGSGWRIVSPGAFEVDGAAVAALIDALGTLRAHRFVDRPVRSSRTRLDQPEYELLLDGMDGEREPGTRQRHISVGGRVEPAHRLGLEPASEALELRYVQGAESALYLVPAAQLEQLPRSVFALRFKQLSQFSAEAAAVLEFAFHPPVGAPTEHRLARTAGDDAERAGWELDGVAARSARVGALLAWLSDLRATEVVADALGPDERRALGFDPATLRVRVHGQEAGEGGKGELLADLQLGSPGRRGAARAMRPDRREIYELPAEFATVLPLAPEEFYAAFADPR